MTELVQQIRSGDPRALARAATLVEERAGWDLLRDLFPHSGRAAIVGVTGAPGSGKSTLVDQLTREWRARGSTAGIIAVDPSSPYTGGAILGDRIRMQSHHGDPGVFIRSMASRGRLGGLAPATHDMALLLDAAGRDVVLNETVGVGQAEVDIARLADVTVVVLVPGMGDDVQALKAGLMEIASVVAINKSDLPGAGKLELEIRQQLSLGGQETPILSTVATEGKGTAALVDAITACRAAHAQPGRIVERWRLRLSEMLRERLLDRFDQRQLEAAAREVAERRRDPYSIVEEWLRQ